MTALNDNTALEGVSDLPITEVGSKTFVLALASSGSFEGENGRRTADGINSDGSPTWRSVVRIVQRVDPVAVCQQRSRPRLIPTVIRQPTHATPGGSDARSEWDIYTRFQRW